MKHFILDVDGVMTTGQFLYSEEGKAYKVFGPDDADGLALVKPLIQVQFISADKRGFPISERRISQDMGYPLSLVASADRLEWISRQCDLSEVIYMADGMVDASIFPHVGYSICPANGFHLTKDAASFVTRHEAGNRAVAEACLHIIDRFF